MIFRKKFLLLTLFFIIIFQILLYTNNNNKTSFRYLKWTIKEVSVGKLITFSFFSGLIISSLLNNTFISFNKQKFVNNEENYETLNNEDEDIDDVTNSNMEMPPQRDIRDTQPTISVNYRVLKNTEKDNLKRDKNYSNSSDNENDWDNYNNDW